MRLSVTSPRFLGLVDKSEPRYFFSILITEVGLLGGFAPAVSVSRLHESAQPLPNLRDGDGHAALYSARSIYSTVRGGRRMVWKDFFNFY